MEATAEMLFKIDTSRMYGCVTYKLSHPCPKMVEDGQHYIAGLCQPLLFWSLLCFPEAALLLSGFGTVGKCVGLSQCGRWFYINPHSEAADDNFHPYNTWLWPLTGEGLSLSSPHFFYFPFTTLVLPETPRCFSLANGSSISVCELCQIVREQSDESYIIDSESDRQKNKDEVLHSSGINRVDYEMLNEQMILLEIISESVNAESSLWVDAIRRTVRKDETYGEPISTESVVGENLDVEGGLNELEASKRLEYLLATELLRRAGEACWKFQVPQKKERPIATDMTNVREIESVLPISLEFANLSPRDMRNAEGCTVMLAPMHNETVDSSSNSGASKKPAADELIEGKGKASAQHGSSHQKGGNPPLDRIHLET
ncbi:hypothetical protein HAX54_007454 [Datura stramonium]|uniref:PH domain-containing protein n=1 Tax=Datura stramonium TaxID=4076 RepID=A0ABS8TDL8_DATST|nr:hypothetical protein [Datura stramonium]